MHRLSVTKDDLVELPNLIRGVVFRYQKACCVEADGPDLDVSAGGEERWVRAVDQSCVVRRHEALYDKMPTADQDCGGVVEKPQLRDLLIAPSTRPEATP